MQDGTRRQSPGRAGAWQSRGHVTAASVVDGWPPLPAPRATSVRVLGR